MHDYDLKSVGGLAGSKRSSASISRVESKIDPPQAARRSEKLESIDQLVALSRRQTATGKVNSIFR